MDEDIYYDLYLLNGNPEGKVKSIVRQQFSYDNQVSNFFVSVPVPRLLFVPDYTIYYPSIYYTQLFKDVM